MSEFFFVVKVVTDNSEHANQVIQERVYHDEDYGFEYTIEVMPNDGNSSGDYPGAGS